MRERERLYQLLDTVPDTKIAYLIGYIQGMNGHGIGRSNCRKWNRAAFRRICKRLYKHAFGGMRNVENIGDK